MTLRRGGNLGTPASVVIYSPARRKRIQEGRKRQEGRWAARSGEVTVSRIQELDEPHECCGCTTEACQCDCCCST